MPASRSARQHGRRSGRPLQTRGACEVDGGDPLLRRDDIAGPPEDHERDGSGPETERDERPRVESAEKTGEDMWRLPLNSRLREQLKSPVADMRNTGDRFGGAITAGLFLKTFAKDTPWVHVDIAGPASLSSSRPSQPKGGTGFAVATIVEYATRS